MAAHALHHGFVVGMPEASGLPCACDGHHAREFTENIEQLLQQRSKTQYPRIEPYLHGAIYAANPYQMHFMEHINYDYLRWSTFSRVTLNTLADEMACAAFGTYQYEDFLSTLKKQAKKLDCTIEEMRAQGDEWVYEIEL